MNNIRQQRGFALIQVMLIAILLFSLMYSVTRLSQNKQRHVDHKNSGNIMSVIINELVDNTLNDNQCSGGSPHPLQNCVEISTTMQSNLKDMGIDTSQATVVVKDERID